jgi:outer membrane protein OmpA-like peptidoglycan-associated protein
VNDAGVVVTASNALELIGAGALVAATLDSDGDGLVDEADRCPVQPEDFDDFEDEDGCPELDNDQDGVVDGQDRCPLEAETPNGIDDDDGCPDVAPDADNDGLADSADRCPFEPETSDGVRDDDGCPEYQGPRRPALAALMAPPVVTPERAPTQEHIEAALEYGRGDADSDGLIDDADRCPITPEDLDGFEDEDGCPEPDNDGDAIADAKDRCPDDAETVNGWEDEDGCPDVHQDLDGDGLLYDADRCPLEPGDATDGCPHVALPKLALPGFPGMPASVEKPAAPTDVTPAPSDVTAAPTETTPVAVAAADFDGDQTPDAADRCPMSAEDADGFEDEDGCPEPDNDADGIPDAKDKCPFAAETINGVRDDDGCPDKGASKVSIEGEHVVIKGVILFTPGSAKLTGASMPLLKQVAATLNAAKSLTVEVQGHTDDVGSAAKNIRLSKQRADAIRAVLIKGGVAANRLIANGYGPTRPVASNKTAKGREKNRRVEFLILGESR